MATVSEALQELSITEWVLRGEPKTEDEFKSMFRKVTGATADNTAIESADTSKWGVTWKQVSEKNFVYNEMQNLLKLIFMLFLT